MALGEWVKSNVDYGRRLVDSGLEGARSGQEEFLNGEPLTPFLGKTVRGALRPAAVGVGVGLLVGYPISRKKSMARTLLYGLVGGAIGLGLGLAWENRSLSASVAGGALKHIGKVRDEKWLSKNPINYA
jgi:hypothetical protein